MENHNSGAANPHAIRDTIAMLGETRCNSPEEFKAWSQNLGHEHVLTTFTSYGNVAQHRQDEILNKLASNEAAVEHERQKLVAVEPERLDRLERMIANLGASAR